MGSKTNTINVRTGDFDTLLEAFRKHIRESQLIREDQRLLVANSGGIDSMVLTHLLLKSGFEMGVAHMNFQLRGKDSDRDQQFVGEFCQKRGLIFHDEKVAAKTYASQKGISIQMAARELRYEWFQTLCRDHHYDALVTAHQANDNLETALFNLTKGTGIKGIGIPEKAGNVVRPLLPFSRDQIRDYAEAEHIEWREDRTNQDAQYHRNFIRKDILPSLLKINPSVVQGFYGTYLRFLGVSDFFEEEVTRVRHDHFSQDGDVVNLDLSWRTGTPVDLAILDRLLEPFGFSFRQLKQLSGAWDGQAGKQFFNKDYQMVLDRGALIITPFDDELKIDLKVPDYDQVDTPMGIMQFERIRENFEIEDDPNVAILDTAKIRLPLKLRNWSPGDRFRPLGMKGSKKLSDYLVDQKVPRSEKSRILVLENCEGTICWVVGMQINDHFKLTDETREAIRVRWSPR